MRDGRAARVQADMADAVVPGEGSAEARAAAVALLEPDLHGLLQRKSVGEALQARLALAGVEVSAGTEVWRIRGRL